MKPSVIYNLDEPRVMRFDMRAVVEFEEATGIPLQTLPKRINATLCAKACLCMLRRGDPNMTLDKLYDLVDEHSSIEEMISKVGEALTLAFERKDKSPNAKPTEK